MAAGLLLGQVFPGLKQVLEAVTVMGTSLSIALGLLLMMHPVLAKVRYEDMSRVVGDRRMLWLPLVLNWLVGPRQPWVIRDLGDMAPPSLASVSVLTHRTSDPTQDAPRSRWPQPGARRPAQAVAKRFDSPWGPG